MSTLTIPRQDYPTPDEEWVSGTKAKWLSGRFPCGIHQFARQGMVRTRKGHKGKPQYNLADILALSRDQAK